MQKLYYVVVAVFAALCVLPAQAQVQDLPLGGNGAIDLSAPAPAYAKRIQLKVYDSLGFFFDDFSRRRDGRPDPNLWEPGSNVFINNNLALDPPSRNVATFDGLNAQGNPYNVLASASAPLDSLISVPIDLVLQPSQQDFTYLSFYWQAGGHSPVLEPDAQDSLVLQFKDRQGNWTSVWRMVGGNPTAPFAFASVKVVTAYQYSGFQFRFINYGSRSGLFDLWHVDYIYLKEGRTQTSQAFEDLAYSSTLTVPFKQYAAMPWTHYNLNPIGFLSDTFQVRLKNFNNVNLPVVFGPPRNIVAIDPSASLVDESNNQVSIDLPRSAFQNITTPFGYTDSVRNLQLLTSAGAQQLPLTVPGPARIAIEYKLNAFISGNIFTGNDTIRARGVLDDYYAYDDGSAEIIRQVGGNNARVAMAFENAKADSLHGIQIYFPPVPQYVVGTNPPPPPPTFVLMVFYQLGTQATGYRDSLYYRETVTAVNAGSRGVFATYKLRRPTFIPAGRFYVGYQQGLGAQNTMKVGADVQANAKGTMYYNSLGDWQQYNADSYALMIRPLFGRATLAAPVKQLAQRLNARVYPNPARTQLTVEGEGQQATLYNLQGQQLGSYDLRQSRQINVEGLNAGVYLLRVVDGSGFSTTLRVVRE